MTIPSVQANTRIIGIFGNPIAHSRSPGHAQCCLPSAGLALYLSSLLRPRCGAGQGYRQYAGAEILPASMWTVPHKGKILRSLDVLSPAASLYKAVNTVINRRGKLYGENTDGQGFLRSLAERKRSVRDREVVLIGAGGAARAVLVALIQAGSAQITIANRTQANANRLIRAYQALGTTQVTSAPLEALQDTALLKRATLIVNSIPLGLHNDTFPALDYGATPRRCFIL